MSQDYTQYRQKSMQEKKDLTLNLMIKDGIPPEDAAFLVNKLSA
jgi:hypothetical protein